MIQEKETTKEVKTVTIMESVITIGTRQSVTGQENRTELLLNKNRCTSKLNIRVSENESKKKQEVTTKKKGRRNRKRLLRRKRRKEEQNQKRYEKESTITNKEEK